MTITFENDNDVLVYALDRIISYARRTQQVFVAQCVWWLASIIGLDSGLVNYIDTQQSRYEMSVQRGPSVAPSSEPEDSVPQRQDKILKECEEYLRDSRRLRDLAKLKTSGNHRTGRINPLSTTKRSLGIAKNQKKHNTKTEGIEGTEINRRKSAGECLRCAWPSDRKGCHQVKDCIRPIKLDTGTAGYPAKKVYQKKVPSDKSDSDSDSE
jgi:hypothetical protein